MVDEKRNKDVILNYLEFYSGIGGWGLALQQACKDVSSRNEFQNSDMTFKVNRLAAFDHSDLANSVLAHNSNAFLHKESSKASSDSVSEPECKRIKNVDKNEKRRKKKNPLSSVSIERLTSKQLNQFGAHIWVMSPPW